MIPSTYLCRGNEGFATSRGPIQSYAREEIQEIEIYRSGMQDKVRMCKSCDWSTLDLVPCTCKCELAGTYPEEEGSRKCHDCGHKLKLA